MNRDETLRRIEVAMNHNEIINDIPADGLTIGETFVIFKAQLSIFRAQDKMARLLSKMAGE